MSNEHNKKIKDDEDIRNDKNIDQKEGKTGRIFGFFDKFFFGNFFSILKDSEEARNDDAKFKEMVKLMLSAILSVSLLIGLSFLISYLF